jgi:hypothetical protein
MKVGDLVTSILPGCRRRKLGLVVEKTSNWIFVRWQDGSEERHVQTVLRKVENYESR